MNIHFNIMEPFSAIRKEDFVKIFVEKYPKVKPKDLHKELTAVNRDFGIPVYHEDGFIFEWGGDIVAGGINWGRFISSFNIQDPTHIVTTGGNFVYNYSTQKPHAIHPNIYNKPLYFDKYNEDTKGYYVQYGTGYCMQVCLWGNQPNAVINFTKLGLLYSAIQTVKSMLEAAERGYAKWDGFKFRSCQICDERITEEQGDKCPACSKLERGALLQ